MGTGDVPQETLLLMRTQSGCYGDPLSEVSVPPLLLGLPAALPDWYQEFCPLMLHHDLWDGMQGVFVDCYTLLTLFPSLILDAREWT